MIPSLHNPFLVVFPDLDCIKCDCMQSVQSGLSGIEIWTVDFDWTVQMSLTACTHEVVSARNPDPTFFCHKTSNNLSYTFYFH